MDIKKAQEIIKQAITQNALELRLNNLKLTQQDLIKLIPDIIKLQNLEYLSIGANQISEIPKELVQLKNLKTLYLFNNQISEIPKEISQLQNLEELSLFGNRISDIPEEIGQLKNLKSLNLTGNQITEIPEEISRLQNLEELNLIGNQITEIPEEIFQLRSLQNLLLSQNKDLEGMIPLEILQDYRNPRKILTYYFKVKTSETRPINEAKIVVIGEANVGKTSLINRLIYDKVLPTNSTHGINIRKWIVEINDEYVQLNVWDFGGQEIMHSTHQFFFTNRTIYILVINARENEESNKIEEWLKRVESFGGNSPVIIVGNKIDENDRSENSTEIGYFDVNRRALSNKYPNIKGFYGVSSDDRAIQDKEKKQKYEKLFDEFRGNLLEEIGNLEGLHQPFPSDWYAVKENLEQLQRENIPFISYNQYINECVEENVKDEISQRTIVEYLNEVGIIIYFKDLPDTMVFNPEWITRAVYAIVDNPSIVQNKGELEISQLNKFLHPEEYPPSKHKYILDIMRKFELCVDIEPNRKFLIPDLLPLDEPYTGDWNNTLYFQFQYETYLKNIFTRFIVRIFPYIYKKTYWRSGVVVALEASKALVKADAQEKKVSIQIQGDNIRSRQKLLAVIHSEFEKIHSNFRFRKPDEFIAHPSITITDTDGKEILLLKDYKELIAMEEIGESEVFVRELRRRLPISDWLDGITTKETRQINITVEDPTEKFKNEVKAIEEEKKKNQLSDDESEMATKEAIAALVLRKLEKLFK